MHFIYIYLIFYFFFFLFFIFILFVLNSKTSTRNASAETLDLIHQTVLDFRADFLKRKQTFVTPNLALVVPSSVPTTESENNNNDTNQRERNGGRSGNRDNRHQLQHPQRYNDRSRENRNRDGRREVRSSEIEDESSNKRKVSSVVQIDEGEGSNKRQKTSESNLKQNDSSKTYVPENPTGSSISVIELSAKPKSKNLVDAVRYKLVCQECQLEFPNLDYLFFKEGIEADFTVQGIQHFSNN
jgi:hypothetical protein